MPDIKLLESELTQTLERHRALEIEHGVKPTPAAREEMASLHSRAMKVRTLLEDEQEKARRHDMQELNEWVEKPIYRTPKAIDNDDNGKRSLIDAGWEFRGGMAYVPVAGGKHYPLVEEEVLFGPLPEKREDRQYFMQTRAIAQPMYRQAYEKFLRTAVSHRSEAMAMQQLTSEEQRALSEGIDTAGGYLVPPDLQAEVLQRTAQSSVIRRLARVVNTSRDRIIFPRVEAASTNASIYSSGFVGSWAGETPAFTETDPAFGTFELTIKKLRVATKLSNDFIADSATPILGWLAQNGAENMALTEDQGFIAGNGTALQPLGLLNDSGISTANIDGGSDLIAYNATYASSSVSKIVDWVYALPGQYAPNASIIFSRAVEGKIRKLPDGQGRPMWPEYMGSGFAPAPRQLLGFPVYNTEWMQNDGTDTNKVALLGDFSNFIIAQRAQISTVVLRERFADTDQTGIILFERVGGGIWNTDAFRFAIV
jgi:HK97 family phage major capsid protein